MSSSDEDTLTPSTRGREVSISPVKSKNDSDEEIQNTLTDSDEEIKPMPKPDKKNKTEKKKSEKKTKAKAISDEDSDRPTKKKTKAKAISDEDDVPKFNIKEYAKYDRDDLVEQYTKIEGDEPPLYADHLQLARWLYEDKYSLDHTEFENLKKTSSSSKPGKKVPKKTGKTPTRSELKAMTVAEIRAVCVNLGFKNASKCSTKDKLIEFVESGGDIDCIEIKKTYNFTASELLEIARMICGQDIPEKTSSNDLKGMIKDSLANKDDD
jgi:hypothetical protein